MNYRELQAALAVFDLGERATLKQIKARHRELAKTHHPDRNTAGGIETMRRVNAAYALLVEYCNNYRYAFSETEFLEQHPEERLRRQFGWDPVWGGESSEK